MFQTHITIRRKPEKEKIEMTIKKQITVYIALFIVTSLINAQRSDHDAHLGMNLSTVFSGSGHGSGYAVNGNLTKGRKAIEVGFIYKEKENKITGGDFKYKLFLGELGKINDEKTVLKPYLQYNILYQTLTTDEPVSTGIEKSSVIVSDNNPGMVATMEHYGGVGLQIKLFHKGYLDTSLGMGTYMGSVSKISTPDAIGIHKKNHGYTISYKVGFGYRFN